MAKTRFIGVVSGKGGAGKTTTALNLASALNELGRDVILVDANLTTPNMGINLGTPSAPVTLHDVLKGKKSIKEAVYYHPSGIKVIPGSISYEAMKSVNAENINEHLAELVGKTEAVIIDSAPGFGKEAKEVMGGCDELIVVTQPNLASVADALKTVKLAKEMKKKVLGVVVNNHRGDHLDMKNEEIEMMLNHKVIGTIPFDKNMREAMKMGFPIVYSHPETRSTTAYKKLAGYLIGQPYQSPIKPKKGVLEFLKKKLEIY